MRSGLLTDIIYIDKPFIEKSETGAEITKYKRVIKCRSHVTNRGGSVTNENGDVFYSKSIVFEIRQFYKEVNENYRITWNGRHYNITYIERLKSNQSIRLEAELINDFEIEKEYEQK